jgi:hypothetical protein
MASDAAGCGSTVSFIIFAQEVLLLLAVAVRSSVTPQTAAPEAQAERDVATEAVSGRTGNGDELDDDTRFLYDVVAREHERLVQNTDAIDNALIAIAVGIIAAALFAADKFVDLQPDDRCAAFFLLGESAVATIAGYLSRTPDFGSLHGFLVDFAAWPLAATLTAVEGLTEASKASRTIRRVKRYCVILATVLVVAAGIVIIVGRAHGMRG